MDAFIALQAEAGPAKTRGVPLAMHRPSILICPLAQPDFDVLVRGTQLSVSGTGLVPAGQPCGFTVAVMRLQLALHQLEAFLAAGDFLRHRLVGRRGLHRRRLDDGRIAAAAKLDDLPARLR